MRVVGEAVSTEAPGLDLVRLNPGGTAREAGEVRDLQEPCIEYSDRAASVIVTAEEE